MNLEWNVTMVLCDLWGAHACCQMSLKYKKSLVVQETYQTTYGHGIGRLLCSCLMVLWDEVTKLYRGYKRIERGYIV